MAVQHFSWEPELLAQNQRKLRHEYERKLREYESRYELSSANAEKALASGSLHETAEVCDWMIAYHFYQSLQSEP
jgi:hypothetical protein